MTDFFLELINRSISASYLVLAVLLVRPLLKKSPKWILVLLWGIVAVRLLCPISLESALSLIPSAQTIPPTITVDTTPHIQSGIPALNSAVNPILSGASTPNPGDSANPLQITVALFTWIWLAGTTLMLLYSLGSYWNLRFRLRTAVRLEGNRFQSERVESPFVLGLLCPRIYLPFHLEQENRNFVIAHEEAHIRRKDHWWKPLGFLLLSLHWFNPVMWLAYWLLCRDIELACDEAVIRKLDHVQKADYSQALLRCSVDRRRMLLCPLAFGEVGVAQRVKSILHYKKPGFWICVISVVICLAVAVCFLTNPSRDSFEIQFNVPAGSQEEYIYATEEILPQAKTITLSSGDNLPDTEFVLESLDSDLAYGPIYLTPGMPVTLTVEPGWYRVGINVQNPGENTAHLSMRIDGIAVRISEYAPYFTNQYYTIYQVLYESSKGSCAQPLDFQVPSYHLGKDVTLGSMLDSQWATLGTMEEFQLTQKNFDDLILETEDSQWNGNGKASDIRKNNRFAWKLIYGQNQLYYLLMQTNGELYLANGYYDHAEAGDPGSDDTTIQQILWLHPLTSIPAEASLWIDDTINDSYQSIIHPAFPDVRFSFDSLSVSAIQKNGVIQELFTGMPIHNVSFADLTGDGDPELCATISFGSGLIDSRVVVYDYRNQQSYTLQERGYFDYRLSLEDDHLFVTKYPYGINKVVEQGYLTMAGDTIALLPAQKKQEPDQPDSMLELYRTDYIGNAVNVSKIAQLLPYPQGYQYSYVEIHSDAKPYGLTIYLSHNAMTGDGFDRCDELIYENIGNADFVVYRDFKTERILHTSSRDHGVQGKYHLTIGAENVTQILLNTSSIDGVCANADGSAYRKGGQIWLEPLDGLTDLRGLTITAQDAHGNLVWMAMVADDPTVSQERPAQGGWELTDGLHQCYYLIPVAKPFLIPTDANLEGIVDNYLFLLQGSSVYRYQRSQESPSGITPTQKLNTFVEQADPFDVTWDVYATKEFPGTQTLYVATNQGMSYLYEYSPPKRCDENALEEARKNGWVVVEDGLCYSDMDAWMDFYHTAQAGAPAKVELAHYTTLDKRHIAPELYEAIKEDYPSLTHYTISFENGIYTLTGDGSSKEYTYLRYFPDFSPESSNPMSRYVLTNHSTATWDELWQSMASSVAGAYIDHFTVLQTSQS